MAAPYLLDDDDEGSVCLVQYDNRSGKELNEKFPMGDLVAYTRHGCHKDKTCKYIDNVGSRAYDDLPPWWAKVSAVRDAMRDESCEYVMWLDTDATTEWKWSHAEIAKAVVKEKTIGIARDPKAFGEDINAGVFVVRNNDSGQQFMDKWRQQFQSECWEKTPARDGNGTSPWNVNSKNTNCDTSWAGRSYEQGTLNSMYQSDSDPFNIMPYCSMQQGLSSEPESKSCQGSDNVYTRHFAVHKKRGMEEHILSAGTAQK
jgi:hypothetical protein